MTHLKSGDSTSAWLLAMHREMWNMTYLNTRNLAEKRTAGQQIVVIWVTVAAAAGVPLAASEQCWSWSCRVAQDSGFIQSAGRPAQGQPSNLRSSGENLAVSMPGVVASVLSHWLLIGKVASQPRMRMNGGGPLWTRAAHMLKGPHAVLPPANPRWTVWQRLRTQMVRSQWCMA